jgi:hypothetical protein
MPACLLNRGFAPKKLSRPAASSASLRPDGDSFDPLFGLSGQFFELPIINYVKDTS